MAVKSIGLIAAMPEEIKPLIKRVGPVTAKRVAGFSTYRFSKGGSAIFLIESGIGAKKAKEATRALIEMAAPGIILNFGFGGAVLPGPAVGDIVIAERLFSFSGGDFSEQKGLSENAALTLQQKCWAKPFRVHRGTFVTTAEIIEKQYLARILPAGAKNPVLEMESTAVAEAASEFDIAVAALRAVSDGADEHLDFSIADISDRELRIRVWRVVWMIARKPWVLPQLIRLGRNSRLAADNLAVAVIAFIDGISHTSENLFPPSQPFEAADHG